MWAKMVEAGRSQRAPVANNSMACTWHASISLSLREGDDEEVKGRGPESEWFSLPLTLPI